MSTTEAAFYDEAMTAEDAPSMLPLDASPWLPMYVEAARWVPSNHDVVDLGCGTGGFARALTRTSWHGAYTGLDFSAAALLEASQLDLEVEASFALQPIDLRDWQPDPQRRGATTYVCLEVLEHLADDRELVSRIPPGHQLIASVPNFESEAHLRVFRNAGDVFQRYERWLSIRRWSLVDLGGGKAIHLIDAFRRFDSW